MRIALISPPPIDQNNFREHSYQPLGLLYLAAQLKGIAEFKIFDFAQTAFCDWNLIKGDLGDFAPDIAAITTTFDVNLEATRRVSGLVRAACPQTTIVIGGIASNFRYPGLLLDGTADAVVLGEGEESFKEFVLHWDQKGRWQNIPGLACLSSGHVVKGPHRLQILNLDQIPFPDFSLLGRDPGSTISLYSSRGCGMGCSYCACNAFWGHWRARSADNVANEIQSLLSKYHVSQFHFMDENFCFDPRRVFEFCQILEDRQLKIKWGCSARPEQISEPLVMAMQKAGCQGIFMGIESGSDAVLRRIGRNYTVAEAKKAVEICMRNGLVATVSFIIGLPGERREDVKATFQLMMEMETFNIELSILFPLLGTPLARNPGKYGIEVIASKFSSGVSKACIQNEHLSASDLDDLYCEGLGIIKKKGRKGANFYQLALAQELDSSKINESRFFEQAARLGVAQVTKGNS